MEVEKEDNNTEIQLTLQLIIIILVVVIESPIEVYERWCENVNVCAAVEMDRQLKTQKAVLIVTCRIRCNRINSIEDANKQSQPTIILLRLHVWLTRRRRRGGEPNGTTD